MKKRAALLYPKILLVDTTEREQCQLSLVCQDQPTIRRRIPTRAQELAENIERLLDDSGIGFTDLRALAVLRRGPTLTGIRIGLATTNTLAWLHGLPIIPFDEENFETAITKLESGKLLDVVKQAEPLD